MNNIETTLAQLAITSAETEVYLLLLETPRQQIADLVRSCSYHRPRLMDILASLEKKQLVAVAHQGARKVYSAAPPYMLVERAKKTLVEANALLPVLMNRQQKQPQQDSIRTFVGEAGLSTCFLDVVLSLKKHDVFYRFSSASDQQYVDSLVPEEYRPLRDAKELERKVITSRYVGGQKQSRLERSVRYFDESDQLFEHNVVQFIYSDKISLLDFNTLTGTIIKNKAIADFQKSIFLALYKRLDRDEVR
jgi:sugar-specific transcriptional regulator TrmB